MYADLLLWLFLVVIVGYWIFAMIDFFCSVKRSKKSTKRYKM
jgi:type III secretory pathway component EscU